MRRRGSGMLALIAFGAMASATLADGMRPPRLPKTGVPAPIAAARPGPGGQRAGLSRAGRAAPPSVRPPKG